MNMDINEVLGSSGVKGGLEEGETNAKERLGGR